MCKTEALIVKNTTNQIPIKCVIVVKEVDQNSVSVGVGVGRHTKLQEHLQRRLDERKMHRQRKSASSSSSKGHSALKYNKSTNAIRTPIQSTASISPIANKIANGLISQQPLNNRQITNTSNVKEPAGSDVERDPSRVVCFPPAKLMLPVDVPVTEIACGLHHTVLLLQNGQVINYNCTRLVPISENS